MHFCSVEYDIFIAAPNIFVKTSYESLIYFKCWIVEILHSFISEELDGT